MVKIYKPQVMAIDSKEYAPIADFLKQSEQIAANGRDGGKRNIMLAYLNIMPLLAKLPHLGKRSEAKVAVRKALLENKAPPAKVKRLVENSTKFLTASVTLLPEFRPAAAAGNIGLMEAILEKAKIDTEAKIGKFGDEPKIPKSPAEKMVDGWKKLNDPKDAAYDPSFIASEAEIILSYLSFAGFIEGEDGPEGDELPMPDNENSATNIAAE